MKSFKSLLESSENYKTKIEDANNKIDVLERMYWYFNDIDFKSIERSLNRKHEYEYFVHLYQVYTGQKFDREDGWAKWREVLNSTKEQVIKEREKFLKIKAILK